MLLLFEEPPLHAGNGVAQAAFGPDSVFMEHNPGNLILELNVSPDPIIQIDDRRFMGGSGVALVEGIGNVDLPVFVPRGAGVVGKQRGACERRPRKNKNQKG